MEIWVPAFGYEGLYSVSSAGRVRSEDRVVKHHRGGPKRLTGAILKPHQNKHGYLQLTLCKENVRTKHSVHRLVLMSFTKTSPQLDTRHIDGSRQNNAIANLEWGTRTDNMQDCVKHGRTNRGSRNPRAVLDEDKVRSIRRDSRSQSAIAAEYGVDQSTISNVIRGKHWDYVT